MRTKITRYDVSAALDSKSRGLITVIRPRIDMEIFELPATVTFPRKTWKAAAKFFADNPREAVAILEDANG